MHTTTAIVSFLLSLTAGTAMAGTVTDLGAMMLGTSLTGGAYIPYKMIALRRRCHDNDNNSEDACSREMGCNWTGEECKAGSYSDYMRDVKAYCAMLDQGMCEESKYCGTRLFGKGCKPRLAGAIRFMDDENDLTDAQVEAIEQERQGEEEGAALGGSSGKAQTGSDEEGDNLEKELVQSEQEELQELDQEGDSSYEANTLEDEPEPVEIRYDDWKTLAHTQ